MQMFVKDPGSKRTKNSDTQTGTWFHVCPCAASLEWKGSGGLQPFFVNLQKENFIWLEGWKQQLIWRKCDLGLIRWKNSWRWRRGRCCHCNWCHCKHTFLVPRCCMLALTNEPEPILSVINRQQWQKRLCQTSFCGGPKKKGRDSREECLCSFSFWGGSHKSKEQDQGKSHWHFEFWLFHNFTRNQSFSKIVTFIMKLTPFTVNLLLSMQRLTCDNTVEVFLLHCKFVWCADTAKWAGWSFCKIAMVLAFQI